MLKPAILCVALCGCSFPSVVFSDDAATTSDAAGDAGQDVIADPCDKDNDGFKAQGACGGNDCNDNDPRVNPNAGFTTDVPDAAPWGDWNCDGTVEYQYLVVACGATSCNAQGFESNTGCGVSGQFVTCTGVLCPAVDAGTRTQACR